MKRGEIYYANLDPALGSETRKNRPVLIISNNANNRVASTITIIPLTSNIQKVYPFEVLLSKCYSGLPKDSKAQCHQIRTISVLRVDKNHLLGTLARDLMKQIADAVKLHLDLP